MNLSVSVIIPFYNAAQTLSACLEGLMNQSDADFECIMVDNHSSDNSVNLVSSFAAAHPQMKIHLLHEGNPGAAAARNAGARVAAGDLLVFTDSDCIPAPDWIATLKTAYLQNPTSSAFAGNILPAPSDNRIGRFLGLYTLPSLKSAQVYREYTLTNGGFPTANLAVRKSVFASIDGFDSTANYAGEDHLFCIRLYQSGATIQTLPAATVRHIHRGTIKGLIRQSFSYGYSHAFLLRRLTHGHLIVQAPFIHIHRPSTNFRMWIDLNSADKKALALLILSLFSPFLLILFFLYLLYLAASILRRSVQRGERITGSETLLFPILLLTKSFAMTTGRVYGSIRHGVLCV